MNLKLRSPKAREILDAIIEAGGKDAVEEVQLTREEYDALLADVREWEALDTDAEGDIPFIAEVPLRVDGVLLIEEIEKRSREDMRRMLASLAGDTPAEPTLQ